MTASAASTPEPVGTQTELFCRVALTRDQLATLTITSPAPTYAGHDGSVWLGLQAYALRIPEVKRRGLAERVPDVTLANLATQRYRASIAEQVVG